MRVGLMIPCYVDMFYPEVGVATLELLEKLGVEVGYPFDQTCCGQPMANSGAHKEAKATEELFIRNFARYDHIVAPSGSCVHHLRNKFTAADETSERQHVSAHVHDLPEFLCDVLRVQAFPWAEFPHQVALHVSCSALRGLHEQAMSERPNDPWFSKPRSLLEKVSRYRRRHGPPRPGRHHPDRRAHPPHHSRHRQSVTAAFTHSSLDVHLSRRIPGGPGGHAAHRYLIVIRIEEEAMTDQASRTADFSLDAEISRALLSSGMVSHPEPMLSLEVRWILPGQQPTALTEWFARFPARLESREDTYLVDPQPGQTSVKFRQGKSLELKVYQGSPGILEVAGCARGRMESWEKWSFPCDRPGRNGADLPG